MIRELHLRDFRGFERFKLGRLGRVNLLVGRNNSGKTTFLEALELLLARGGHPGVWNSFSRRSEDDRMSGELNIAHLFHGHAPSIGSDLGILAESDSAPQEFICRVRELREESKGLTRLLNNNFNIDSELYLQWKSMGQATEVSFPLTERFGVSRESIIQRNYKSLEHLVPAEFITTESLSADEVILALGEVMLDPEEEFILQALQIIDPTIERIAPVGPSYSSSRRGGVVIKLRNTTGRLPINTMGDGIWRLLALALSLVRARGGVLMIDEIDTGLHYSALEDMWRLVGLTAKRLDIQVFATTHSSDCWKALAAVCADLGGGQEDATIHRIERDKTESVPFTEVEMIIAARSDLEIR